SERDVLLTVSERHDVRLLGLRELGDRVHGRELHLTVDRGRAGIERAAEHEWKAEHVVDLVRIVRTPSRDHRVGLHAPHYFGQYFGLRIGEREDERLFGHVRDYLGL